MEQCLRVLDKFLRTRMVFILCHMSIFCKSPFYQLALCIEKSILQTNNFILSAVTARSVLTYPVRERSFDHTLWQSSNHFIVNSVECLYYICLCQYCNIAFLTDTASSFNSAKAPRTGWRDMQPKGKTALFSIDWQTTS